MKVRTVYFKVDQLSEVIAWWEAFLGFKPSKQSEAWAEFRIGQVNLGFLSLPDRPGGGQGCVPVLEFSDAEVVSQIAKAKALGARAVLEGAEHPDYPNTAAVLVDPFGNEFEVTNYHG